MPRLLNFIIQTQELTMCKCQTHTNYTCHCQPTVKLEVGKKYKARSGTVYEVIAEVKGRFIVTHGRQPEHSLAWRYSNGKFNESSATIAPNDLLEEVKEPRMLSLTVWLVQHKDGSIHPWTVFYGPPLADRKILGHKTVTITEGEGMP